MSIVLQFSCNKENRVSDVKELLSDGKLTEAIEGTTAQVKSAPKDMALRWLLALRLLQQVELPPGVVGPLQHLHRLPPIPQPRRGDCFLLLRVWVVEISTWLQTVGSFWTDSTGTQVQPIRVSRGTQTDDRDQLQEEGRGGASSSTSWR